MAVPHEKLEKLSQEMLTCTMCGYCKMVCPVFLDVKWDSASPRGRMSLAYGLITGEIEPDVSVAKRLFQCTCCTDCYRRCPSKAKCPDVVQAARHELVEGGFANAAQTALVKNVLETGNIFADLSVEFPEQAGDTALFIGCQQLARPNSLKKNLKLLKTLGINPSIVKETCCGFPMEIMGFEKEHAQQKERLQTIFPADGKPVLTFCPSCMVHLKKHYGWNTVHVLEEINRRLESSAFAPAGQTVTYHDPCDLSRGAKITKEPREILVKMGYRLVEMAHAKDQSRCCGGGGGILTWDTELSDHLAVRRIGEAAATGAEMIVTACATCEQTLKKGAGLYAEQTGGQTMPVRHILDLLAKALK